MAYLTLLVGSAGLRKEENLAITPADVQILKMPTSQGVKKYVLLNVHAAYTDEDDLRSPKQKSLIGTLWFFQSLRKGFFQSRGHEALNRAS